MDAQHNRTVAPARAPRTGEQILGRMVGDQAITIARLTALVEQVPALRAEIEQLRAEVAALKAPAKE